MKEFEHDENGWQGMLRRFERLLAWLAHDPNKKQALSWSSRGDVQIHFANGFENSLRL